MEIEQQKKSVMAKFHVLTSTHLFQAYALQEASPDYRNREDIVLSPLLHACSPPSQSCRHLYRGCVYTEKCVLAKQAGSQEPRWQCVDPQGKSLLSLIMTIRIEQKDSGKAAMDSKKICRNPEFQHWVLTLSIPSISMRPRCLDEK